MVEKALLSAGADVFLSKDTLAQDLLPTLGQVLARRVQAPEPGS